ncbi:phosphotransferase family protein [Streptomyces sp. NBC_00094]|uniref:phosphotransferase family protein n=1 Tax=Streptomyces sp. NBC_00094 TaxID=2903620 RepID=UPI002257EB8D|nr:phosphotransferase family protein [Streptomyces sp. NBC_00094]MCX5389361.1 phosphotransferase family protein [Streptomyces sp. NBC_00094]
MTAPAQAHADTPEPSLLTKQLADWLRERLPERHGLAVSEPRPAERGMSTDTRHFTLTWEDDGEPRSERLVLRRPPTEPLLPDYDLARQFRIMRALEDTPLPVPRTRWLESDASVIGTPFYVMDEISHCVTASDFPTYHVFGTYFEATPEGRETMWRRCVETIADVHALDWRQLGLSFLERPEYGDDPLEQQVNYLDHCLRWALAQESEGPQPVLERAVAWLKEHRYTPEHITLCWGDSRMSNILYSPAGYEVRGVLDWEIAFLGDHESDLAWMLFLEWMNTVAGGIAPADGTPSREETVRHYEEITDLPVRHLRYNEVLAALLLAIPLLGITRRMRAEGQLPAEADPVLHCCLRITELIGSESV